MLFPDNWCGCGWGGCDDIQAVSKATHNIGGFLNHHSLFQGRLFFHDCFKWMGRGILRLEDRTTRLGSVCFVTSKLIPASQLQDLEPALWMEHLTQWMGQNLGERDKREFWFSNKARDINNNVQRFSSINRLGTLLAAIS